MTAGYSGTPLVRKLGLRPGFRVRLVDAPDDYAARLGPLPEGVSLRGALRGPLDFVQLFVTREARLVRRLPAAERALDRDGLLWISWPKQASGVATDVTRETVRRHGLAAGLVDVKVCAVDETWSALKFVRPRASR